MPIRITGMNSGLDTDRIIQELVRGQKAKVDNIKKNQTSIQWKQDAWKELNTKALKLFNGALGKMRFSDAYAKKTSKVSNNKATVVTGENAVNGVQNLQIEKLAKTGMLTGAKITKTDGKAVASTTKLSEIMDMSGVSGEMSFTVKSGGKETQINLKGDDTVQTVINRLRDAGLNANFDGPNGRFFISSKTMGEAGDFSIFANNAGGLSAMNALGINYVDTSPGATNPYASLAGILDGPDGTGPVSAGRQADFDKLIAADIAKRLAADKAELLSAGNTVNTLNHKMATKEAEYKGYLFSEHGIDANALGWSMDDVFARMELISSGYQDALTNAKDALENYYDEDDPLFVQADYDDLVAAVADAEADVAKFKADVKYDYSEAAYNADMENIYGVGRAGNGLEDRITALTAKTTDPDVEDLNLSVYRPDAEAKVRNDIEFAKTAVTATGNLGATKIKGEDAKIILNGAEFTNNSNTFNINGLTITANNVTEPGETITITTEDDTDGIYNMIKDFIKEYNILINEMDRLYNAASARDYKPLTEEEKDALSDREIEDWEKKIKDSLLRRDSSLYNISSSMKSAMLDAVVVNGKKMYISDFGIEALSYFLAPANEKNALFIDGDQDSAHTSNKTDKLMNWIANDPKVVTDFFVGLSRNLYESMNKIFMDRNAEFKSAYNLYNDKQLQKEYDNMTKAIARQELKLTALEDKYYKQFSAMEVAMAKMQSSQSAISGLLGMQMQR